MKRIASKYTFCFVYDKIYNRFIINFLLLYFTEPFEFPIITNWDALDDGLQFKQCVKDRVVDSKDPLQQFVVSDDETEMVDLLAQFPPKQRKKILKYEPITVGVVIIDDLLYLFIDIHIL